MTPRTRTIVARSALLLGLLLASEGLYKGRQAFIQLFFVDGAVVDDAPMWPRVPVGDGLRPALRVRVVLLDGLSRSHALRLPQLSAICRAGQELELDVGFPTVSLPVQHALWTGLTQQQSGLQYHIGKLTEPPPHSSPSQVDSLAIAESHPEIVHSFGFTRAVPVDVPEAVTPEWRASGFALAARDAIVSPVRLAFVHVLRIDEAGHDEGTGSLRYGAAAAWSDALLALLHSAAPADPDTLWVVLADHGHRDAGGHGGSEPEIRLVRACVVGGGLPTGETRPMHLIDLARAIADATGTTLTPAASGRPWAAALAEPARGATLPRPGPMRWLLAGFLALLTLLSLRTGTSRHVAWARFANRMPWPMLPFGAPSWLTAALGLGWLALATAGVLAQCGLPTLSNPAIYPKLGRDLLYAGAPAWLALLALAGLASVRWRCTDAALVRATLLPWSLIVLTTLLLCRTPDALIEGTPPLMPWTTGLASMLLVQGRAACLVLALLLAIRGAHAVWRHLRQTRNASRRPPGADLA